VGKRQLNEAVALLGPDIDSDHEGNRLFNSVAGKQG
jgi:hypothetical protein